MNESLLLLLFSVVKLSWDLPLPSSFLRLQTMERERADDGDNDSACFLLVLLKMTVKSLYSQYQKDKYRLCLINHLLAHGRRWRSILELLFLLSNVLSSVQSLTSCSLISGLASISLLWIAKLHWISVKSPPTNWSQNFELWMTLSCCKNVLFFESHSRSVLHSFYCAKNIKQFAISSFVCCCWPLLHLGVRRKTFSPSIKRLAKRHRWRRRRWLHFTGAERAVWLCTAADVIIIVLG